MKKHRFSGSQFWTLLGFEGLDAEEFKKRTTAVQLSLFTVGFGVLYCLTYIFLGFPSVVYIIYVYVTVSMLNLLYLRFSHNYNLFGGVQLGIILLFPLATQLIIGGFTEASGVGLAVFLAPAGALLYAPRSTARICFFFFAVAIIGAAAWEYAYGRPVPLLPRSVTLLFFASNFITICAIVYILLESFLQKQHELRQELRQSINTLRATQAQLIQKEKLASLGELTAGIAHEIQNPLNFVNNFAEVSVELIDELREGVQTNDIPLVLELADDLRTNLQRIVQNGQRASDIVRSMLEHSRTDSGPRHPADLNALADEYLRLSYHGLRAKDKSFNARLVTQFAPDLGLVTCVPQDIGRVLLNLFNNAFYAVAERARQQPTGYDPTVLVRTERLGDQVRIVVRDNGAGIPDSIRDKILQPFFTTKPAGQGTGLGLSLSYDIITNGHGGQMNILTEEGQFTEFTIFLPIKQATYA